MKCGKFGIALSGMKTLVLLRHAKSSWKDPYLSDHDRPLNKRGKRDAPLMAKRYNYSFPKPELVLCSSSTRTKETIAFFALELGLQPDQIEIDRTLYHADAYTILEEVKKVDTSVQTVMVVGHNPGITILANMLQPGITENVPTCGILVFTSKDDTWASFSEGKDIRCSAYITPHGAQD